MEPYTTFDNNSSRTNTLIITDIPSAIERLLEITDSRE